MSGALLAVRTDSFVAGLLIGGLLGLAIGPLLRGWLVWRIWRDADREARLTDQVLDRLMEEVGDTHQSPHARPEAGWPASP